MKRLTPLPDPDLEYSLEDRHNLLALRSHGGAPPGGLPIYPDQKEPMPRRVR